ncbi:response regulator transcription factor [Rhodococcus sp. WB9]|uniref:response regulator transcription factor n=1 Tax=Rhodococcus sp. WB9 TaxID=2594007 RepID=UPI00118686AC|nr:response regulator transcription factor [Rhodococcus sp. WB9]QDQ95314.1 response regulator transcription factor [Rhodococcus sp. WB9]
MRIAVVEDDDGVGNALVAGLTRQAHQPVRMKFGSELLLHHGEVDFVLLDLGLPDRDGLEVLRQLRQVSAVPVIILTARDDERSVVRGLRGGADDYLVKPARMSELFARIEVVRRRSMAVEGGAPREVVTGDVRVDLDSRTVTVAGREVDLTSKEFSLLEILLENPGAAVSRQQLMDRVWGDAFVAVSRSLDVHIGTLRAKLDRPGLISTIRGFGYRWVC